MTKDRTQGVEGKATATVAGQVLRASLKLEGARTSILARDAGERPTRDKHKVRMNRTEPEQTQTRGEKMEGG